MGARTKTNTRLRGASIVARRLAQIGDEAAGFYPDPFIEDRCEMVAEAASARAHRRGSADGVDLEDWLGAEDDIDQGVGQRRYAKTRKSIN